MIQVIPLKEPALGEPPAARRLCDLPPGQQVPLVRLEGSRSLRRRLMELGFLPGTPVQVIRRGGPGGLIEVEARCCRLGLRSAEAALIFVRP